MRRVIVNLNEKELQALRDMAARDVRPIREQARYLIIRGLVAESATQAGKDTGAPDPAARPAVGGVANDHAA